MHKTVAILQSSYVPWKGYFDIIRQVDEFILFDSVQYTRRDWRNRNRIKTKEGLSWLTIPVNVKGKYFQKINETTVSDPGWTSRHWGVIKAAYSQAASFAVHGERIKSLYDRAARLEKLSQVNHLFLTELCEILAISTPLTWDNDYPAVTGKTERLVSICKAAGATRYLSGPSARAYIVPERFEEAAIELTWIDYSGYPEYEQLYPPFDHHVSILDLIFNAGEDAPRYLERPVRPEPPLEARLKPFEN